MKRRPAFAIIVPVHDEAAVLPRTVPALLDGLDAAADLIFVCNGCSDNSAALLRDLVGTRARVLELPEPGKARAIRAGEAASAVFPRIYLDADVRIQGAALNALAARLSVGDCDLAAPLLRADTRGASPAARRVTETWMATPHMRTQGFHCVIGITARGRARWGLFPDLINDDDFISRAIPADRRRIMTEITATIRPPLTFGAWLRVRERWLRGARELDRVAPATGTPGQRGALAAAFLRHPRAVTTYLTARLLAAGLAARAPERPTGWYRDATSRAPADGLHASG